MTPKGLTALREASQLSVEISELLRHPGSTRRLEFTEELPGLALDIGRVSPVLAFDLLLESLVEGVVVGGTVRGSYVLECIRCLREFDAPFSLELSEVMAYPGQPGAEEGYEIRGDHAHLEPLVRDAVLLAMPSNPLHTEDCKGLCQVCGADRNVVDCGHENARVDLRWSPLEKLKQHLGASSPAARERTSKE